MESNNTSLTRGAPFLIKSTDGLSVYVVVAGGPAISGSSIRELTHPWDRSVNRAVKRDPWASILCQSLIATRGVDNVRTASDRQRARWGLTPSAVTEVGARRAGRATVVLGLTLDCALEWQRTVSLTPRPRSGDKPYHLVTRPTSRPGGHDRQLLSGDRSVNRHPILQWTHPRSHCSACRIPSAYKGLVRGRPFPRRSTFRYKKGST